MCGNWLTWSSNDKVDWGGSHVSTCCRRHCVSSGLRERAVQLHYEEQTMREVAAVFNVSVGFARHVVFVSAGSTVCLRARAPSRSVVVESRPSWTRMQLMFPLEAVEVLG